MRLHRGALPDLSRKIAKALIDAGDIEVSDRREAERDIESVLTSYLNQVDQVVAHARDLAHQRGLPQGEFGRIKHVAAEQAGVKVGDDALDYVLEQLISMLMHSPNVEDVFVDDLALKRRMRPFLRAGEEVEQKLKAEVRSKLKHVEEGSRTWEIEYARMKADIKRRKGM